MLIDKKLQNLEFDSVKFIKFIAEGVIVECENQIFTISPSFCYKLYTTSIMESNSAIKYRKSKSQFAKYN